MKTCTKCNELKSLDNFQLRYETGRPADARMSECNSCRDLRRKLRYKNNVEHRSDVKEKGKKYHKDLRLKALEQYGNKCVCCGETTYEFLTFDHINGRSKDQSRSSNNGNGLAGRNFLTWLIKNNCPGDIQILCYNCNCSKGMHGQCPHIKESLDDDRDVRQDILHELECS